MGRESEEAIVLLEFCLAPVGNFFFSYFLEYMLFNRNITGHSPPK